MTHAAKFTIFKMEMEEMLIDDDWTGNKRWPKLVGSNKDIESNKSDTKMMSIVFE